MNKLLLTTLILMYSLVRLAAQESIVVLNKLWESSNQLTTCESVKYDVDAHIIYVSCINGNPTEKDGNGFIALLSETGDVKVLHWVDGLNAPKGMGIFKGALYVTDIDRVVKIDIASATISKEYPVEGAKFLNDIVIGKDGDVFISDMATGIIHRIHDDAVGPWLMDASIDGPNGLNIENGELLIGTRKGILSVRLEDKRQWLLVSHTGGIDGLEPDGHGNYVISDWSGKVQRVNPDDPAILIFDTSKDGINAADIQFLPNLNLLLVPTFGANRVDAYEIHFEKE